MTDISNISPRDKAEILAQALPYIRQFHGKTMVIKYGGNAMTDPELQADFAEDVVLLKLVGMNPVVVHGGGPQIEAALSRLGKKGEFIQGMRVTDAETMEVVEWVLAGEVQQDIVGLINQAGGKAVGLTGRDGGLIRAQKLKMVDNADPSKQHDMGQVGDIVAIDPSVVKALQDDQFIPVISPIGFGAENESYNINADVVAGKLATVLQAEKLVLLTNTPGVLDKDGRNIFACTPDQPADTLRHGVAGLQQASRDCMLMFAPHANSYRRFVLNAFVPLNDAWGFNNRTVAMRIPHSDPANIRIEHRIAGADANPYLVTAAVLAGILQGLEDRGDPGAPVVGNAYEQTEHRELYWRDTLRDFQASEFVARHFGADFRHIFGQQKLKELRSFSREVTTLEYDWYLRQV